MAHHHQSPKQTQEFDKVIQDIADYVANFDVKSTEAISTARLAAIDAIGCGLLALQFPECTKLLGPVVPGTIVPNGVRVPGTSYVLDPVQGAFNIGAMNRWLDFNDTWLAAEWGHPSDNLASVLAIADYISRKNISEGKHPLKMKDVLANLVKTYEIQGCLALENSFNKEGLDHVVLVKVASTAVVTHLLGGTRDEIMNAVSNAWIDGQSLRIYRHFPNTGSRKSWAAGDAASRAVRLSFMALKGEMGYPSALTAKGWGFYDVQFKGKQFKFQRPYGSYVMENVLFKVSFPAEFHAQTAVEAAITLHSQVGNKHIKQVNINTHNSAIRIIDKKGPLNNPADRDHCLQYMAAIGLIFGELKAEHYEDDFAKDPRIDGLRDKMVVVEEASYSTDYHDPEKRSISNAVQVVFDDGTQTEKVAVEYPLGHRRRRAEAIPHIEKKFIHSLQTRYAPKQVNTILEVCLKHEVFLETSVTDFMELFIA